jgi:hypothetical protein
MVKALRNQILEILQRGLEGGSKMDGDETEYEDVEVGETGLSNGSFWCSLS